MATDILAQDMAAQALAARSRVPVAFGIYGQSNEHGNVLTSDAATYPRAFAAARNPGIRVPLGPAVSALGGWWPAVYDDLLDWGYDLHIVNGAVGGLNFLVQSANLLQARANSYGQYFQRRAPSGPGDAGDFGDLIYVGTRVFNCTVGNVRYATASNPFVANYDGVVYTTSGLPPPPRRRPRSAPPRSATPSSTARSPGRASRRR